MARLAFHTFALMRGIVGDAVVQGFVDRNPEVFAVAENTPGYLGRAAPRVLDRTVPRMDWDYGPWGPFALARFYTGGRDISKQNAATTLSLWESIETVGRFAYAGKHGEALKLRHEWFLTPEWPSYVMWWVGDDAIPTWGDAATRLEHLHDHGPSPFAFGFKQSFTPDGQPRSTIRPV